MMIWGVIVGIYLFVFVVLVVLLKLGVKCDWFKFDVNVGN